MNNTQYVRMCDRILNNKIWYRKVACHILDNHKQEFCELIAVAFQEGIITKDPVQFLKVENPMTPKVHKCTQDPPGRPNVSGNNYCLWKLYLRM